MKDEPDLCTYVGFEKKVRVQRSGIDTIKYYAVVEFTTLA